MSDGFVNDFRRFFIRGLAAVLPTILTVVLLVFFFRFIDQWGGRYLNIAAQWVTVQFTCMIGPEEFSWKGPDVVWEQVKSVWATSKLNWIGFVLAFVSIYIFGRFIASFLGRGIWRLVERTFFRVPIIKQVYPFLKQVVDFLLSEKKLAFSRVVAVEYPRKGIWALGLVTGCGMRTVHNYVGGDLLTVFIPSSPTPITGYTITVNRHEVIDLPLSIDDALRFTVSGGVIMPTIEQLSQAEAEQARQGVFPPIETPERKESQ